MSFTESLHSQNLVDIFKSAPFGFVLTDVKGSIVFANRKAEEILGLQPDSLLARTAASQINLFIPGSGFTKKFKKKRIMGKEVALYKTPFQMGGEFGGEMYLFDEIDSSQVINELSLSSDLYRTLESLVESFYDGLIFIENDHVVRVNSSFSRITGLKGESLLGRKVDELDGETHICLHTIQEVIRLVQQLGKSVTSMGTLSQGNEIYVTATPVNLDGPIQHVIVSIRDITELQLLKEEVSRLMALYLSTPEEARISQLCGGEIITESRIMRGILEMVARVAQVDSIVLFEGESGTGKEVLARLIHRLCARRKGPFIPVNCGAIPENLFESELFGYVRGAFTGAVKEGKPGLFELAEGGVIFLDEIGEMPLNCQVKLIKVIEDREVMRIGDIKPTKLNARIITATNKSLPEMVKEGKFREDLFYRLYVVPIKIPPLRERREDIFPLAWHFLRKYNNKFKQSKTFSREIIQVMETYQWPGNVRELQNLVERTVIMTDAEILEPKHLPNSVYQQESDDGSMIQVRGIMSLALARETVEKKLISHALKKKGTTRDAARLLGVDHSTVVRKIKKYGLRPGAYLHHN